MKTSFQLQFKNWFNTSEYMEMSDVRNLPVDSVHFEPIEEDEFDEEEAERECDKEVGYEDYGHRNDIYDDADDDPNFKMESPEQWEEDNPPPDPDEYENGTEDDDYKSDREGWEEEKYDHAKTYKIKLAAWEKEMSHKRYAAEDKDDQARWEAIYSCMDKKREAWNEENKENGGFRSKFKHHEDDFEVTMHRATIKYANQEVPGSFKIEFDGPNGYNTTGKAGSEATTIYTQVLLAVKKLMTTQTVNGITFEPAEPGMALVYQRFYDRFLKNDFTRISPTEAVRTSYIEQINQKLNPYERLMAKRNTDAAEQDTNKYLNQVKDGRGVERKIRTLSQTTKNKVVHMQDGSNIFVGRIYYDANSNKIMIEGITDQGGKYHVVYIPIETITQNPSDMISGNKLLTAITQNARWMKVIEQKPFNDLLKQYNVQIPATV